MTQPASYQVPAHPSGLDMRTQLNVIVLALLGDNVGPVEPPEKYPGMMWGDTTANRLKRRTNANDGWVNIGPLDDFLGDVRKAANDATAAAANKVSKTGDHMTGDLWMDNATIHLHIPNVIQAWLRADAGMPGCGFINNANNAWNLMIADNGNVSVRSAFVVQSGTSTFNGKTYFNKGPGAGTGELSIQSPEGYYFYMRGRGGSGMEWVNNAYNAVVATMDDGGNYWCGNVYSRGECYSGNARLCQDGNIYGSIWGDYLSNWLANNKVSRAQCQHDSGLAEFGNIVQGDSGHGEATCPAPWVMVGLRGARWETWIRGIVLRNQ